MSSARVDAWLSRTEWASWRREPLAGDASSRRYERLVCPTTGQSAILMDAPPEICGSMQPFITIAERLSQLNICAPKMHAYDISLGLMVLEDLGATDFASWIRSRPDDEARLYEHAVDILVVLHNAPAPKGLIAMTPEIGAEMTELALEWYATSDNLAAEFHSAIKDALQKFAPNATTLSLRDFHAENLIWRPELHGNDRVGVLDFQDAFLAPPAYDLASLLRDARRDVSAAVVEASLDRFARSTGRDRDALSKEFSILAVQRNIRILGIFSRLAKRDGKTHYLKLIPRVQRHILTDLDTPSLIGIKPLVIRALSLEGEYH